MTGSDEYARKPPPSPEEACEVLRKYEVPVLAQGMLKAALDGSIAEYADPTKHAQRCAAAGENVMPFPLRRRWPRRVVTPGDWTPEELEALRTAQVPPEAAQYDHECEGWEPPPSDHEGS